MSAPADRRPPPRGPRPVVDRESAPWVASSGRAAVYNGSLHRIVLTRQWTNDGGGDPLRRCTFTDWQAHCGVQDSRHGAATSLPFPPAYRSRALSCKDGCWP